MEHIKKFENYEPEVQLTYPKISKIIGPTFEPEEDYGDGFKSPARYTISVEFDDDTGGNISYNFKTEQEANSEYEKYSKMTYKHEFLCYQAERQLDRYMQTGHADITTKTPEYPEVGKMLAFSDLQKVEPGTYFHCEYDNFGQEFNMNFVFDKTCGHRVLGWVEFENGSNYTYGDYMYKFEGLVSTGSGANPLKVLKITRPEQSRFKIKSY